MHGVRPTSGRGGWRGSCAALVRRSGKCFAGTGSRDGHAGSARATRRYEWSRPGALLHIDVKRLARFSVPGHRVTGDRRTKDAAPRIGYDYLHCVVDDHSRIAYVELHPREDADTNARMLERALAFFAELGLEPPEAVMTDNALVYRTPQRFQALLADRRRSATSARRPTRRAGTARWSASSRRCSSEWAYSRSLAQLEQPRPLAPKLPPLLQPAPTARLTRRPATHQPRSQRPWAGQLDEPPDHPEAGCRSLAKRHERHDGETGCDQRHERAELGLQRVEIGVEALSLGGDLLADLLGAALLRHGSAASRACALPPRAPATASEAKPCGRSASPGTRRSPRRGRGFPPR